MTRDLPSGTLLFFSDTVPIAESGSFIIFRRHLLPLVEAGWQLRVLSYFPAPATSDRFWKHVQLPLRRWFWPPFAPRVLATARVRTWLMARDLRRSGALEGPKPRVLLANLWDRQALTAAHLARRGFGRLGVFVHDDEIAWSRDREPIGYLQWKRSQVLAAADRVWSVSARLGATFPATAHAKTHVLRPIPGRARLDEARWCEEYGRAVHVGYAGKLYPGLVPVLATIGEALQDLGGQLTVITESRAIPTHSIPGVTFREFFPTPQESTTWLAAHCSALLIAHPSAGSAGDTKWSILRTSFPSKLPEMAQLGLPLLLVGDADSEFGDWAASTRDIPFFIDVTSPAFREHVGGLRTRQGWEQAAGAAHRVAKTQFAPEAIQDRFVQDVLQLAR